MDWSQPVEGAGCCLGTSGAVFGCATGNIPLAAFSGTVALTNVVAMARMSCLGDTIQLSHSTDALNHTVDELRNANAAQLLEIQQLQDSATRLHSDLESLHKERDEIRQQQETDQKKIEELTFQLDALQKRYVSVQNSCAAIQRTLSSSAAEHAAVATEMHDDEERFVESLPLLAKGVADLKTAEALAHQENERLQKLLEDLKQEESVLQSQIVKYQQQKAALERLVRAQESEEDLQRKIRDETAQLSSVEQRLAVLMPRLQEMMAAASTGTSSP